jgi:hypothetical protein
VFVIVDEGVRLEVLDWGGTGTPVVLLTGGHTAHVYDEFAPKPNIQGPVMAMLEFPRWASDYQPKTDEERALIEQFVERGKVIVGRWTDKVKRSVPDARFVDLPGAGHYVFMTREADVLRQIHGFVADLPAATPKK